MITLFITSAFALGIYLGRIYTLRRIKHYECGTEHRACDPCYVKHLTQTDMDARREALKRYNFDA